MTPKRWEIVGGMAVGMIFAATVSILMDFALSWQALVISIAAATVGNGIGRLFVRQWLEAGRE